MRTPSEPYIPHALFFGKRDCTYSEQAHALLKQLGFEVTAIWSKSRMERLPENIHAWHGDYIFCFRSYFILPLSLIHKAVIAAINFHPGPPEYPGSGCLNWALYDNAKQYGVTAHLMTEKIDNGAIVECRRFPILPKDDVGSLLAKAHRETYVMLADIVTGLAEEGESFLNSKLNAFKHE